jgi:uncharacterized damage-inducible protein DinB
MLATLRDLVAHKGYANAALLNAVRRNDAAVADRELWDLLHHILLANRFWLLAIRESPFVLDDEARPSASFDALIARFASLQDQEERWLAAATDGDLARMLVDEQIPSGTCSIAQAVLQVCLHSHGHRSQCAKLLRRHGGVPPPSDFIAWLTARPRADWAGTSALP